MENIKVKILNPEVVAESEKMMVFCARLTQRGHSIHNMDELLELYNKSYKPQTVDAMCNLPHPTIQKFGAINIAVVGASRRFLAQITRHQNEVKFMSASLQYSDYSGEAEFCVPIDITRQGPVFEQVYINQCKEAMGEYKRFCSHAGNDAAGYLAPQGLRNILIISATPYQLKHMISQRICRRNTEETRYVMGLIWKELYKLSPMFRNCGPFCMTSSCAEGKMTCGKIIPKDMTPESILKTDFKEIYHED